MKRSEPIAASVANVRRWGLALFTESTSLEAFRSLDVPVLFMTGGRSTAAAHRVARLLVAALPHVEVGSSTVDRGQDSSTSTVGTHEVIARSVSISRGASTSFW